MKGMAWIARHISSKACRLFKEFDRDPVWWRPGLGHSVRHFPELMHLNSQVK
jgi:hypothetical protein